MQFRTSYFPGLGWMMRRQLWEELSPKFPRQAWDHWFRLPTTAQGQLLRGTRLRPGLASGGCWITMHKDQQKQ